MSQKARLVDLCPEDKARVAKLIQTVVQANRQRKKTEEVEAQNEELETRLNKLRQQNSDIIQETASLRAKFAQSLKLLKKYQEKLSALQKAKEEETQKREEAVKEHVKESARLKAENKMVRDRMAVQDAELEAVKEEAQGRRHMEEQLTHLERRHREVTKMQEQERNRLMSELQAAALQTKKEREERLQLEERLSKLTLTIKELESRLREQEEQMARQQKNQVKLPPSMEPTASRPRIRFRFDERGGSGGTGAGSRQGQKHDSQQEEQYGLFKARTQSKDLNHHHFQDHRMMMEDMKKQKSPPFVQEDLVSSPSNAEIYQLKSELDDMRQELIHLKRQKQEEMALRQRKSSYLSNEHKLDSSSHSSRSSDVHSSSTTHKSGNISSRAHPNGFLDSAFESSRAEIRKSLEKRTAELVRSREDLDNSMLYSGAHTALSRLKEGELSDASILGGSPQKVKKDAAVFNKIRKSPSKRSLYSDDDISIKSHRSLSSLDSKTGRAERRRDDSGWWNIPADVLASQVGRSETADIENASVAPPVAKVEECPTDPNPTFAKQPNTNRSRQAQSLTRRSSNSLYEESLFDLVDELETALKDAGTSKGVGQPAFESSHSKINFNGEALSSQNSFSDLSSIGRRDNNSILRDVIDRKNSFGAKFSISNQNSEQDYYENNSDGSQKLSQKNTTTASFDLSQIIDQLHHL